MAHTLADEWISCIERNHDRTRRVSACIPAAYLEHSFAPGRFTLGDLVRHLAAINRYMFAETAAMRPSRYNGHGRELADGLEAVLAFQQQVHAETISVLRGLDPASFEQRCTTPEGASIVVWKWLRAMTEHEAHHRGQIYLYLGLLGVETPPLFGLTSEEVRARSQSGPGEARTGRR